MEIEVTLDKQEMEKMLTDLLMRRGLRLSTSAEKPIEWKTRKSFCVIIKVEVDPAVATTTQEYLDIPEGDENSEGADEDGDLDISTFPDQEAAQALKQAAANELANQIPKLPGETTKRQQKPGKKRKPTRHDREAGR